MRAFLSSTLAVCAALLLLAPATASAAPAARIKIDHTTSAIYQVDISIEGNGPTYDAVSAEAQLRNCPVGRYSLHMGFTQDGVSYGLTPGPLGRGEVTCDASGVVRVASEFMGNGLHPGPATVTVEITRWADGAKLAASSRAVRIPAGVNNPA